jgi:hypothetical protein
VIEESSGKLKRRVSGTIFESRISRIRSRKAVRPEVNVQAIWTPMLDGGK